MYSFLVKYQPNSTQLRKLLWRWSVRNPRPLPWSGIKDPYQIWLSEIILHQTRVSHGIPYYERWISTFPNVHALAKAPLSKVLKLWEGLGYNNRAHNLHQAAQQIVENGGGMPRTYADWIALPGIGPYTAAAITSFAYGLPHAVVDVNVIRVIARIYGIKSNIASIATSRIIQKTADALLDKKDSGGWNQLMMNFGATVCIAKQPYCDACPIFKYCSAFQKKLVDAIPLKPKPVVRKQIWIYYFILKNSKGEFAFMQRDQNAIWPGLHSFPEIQSSKKLHPEEACLIFHKKTPSHPRLPEPKHIYETRQTLTHRQVNATFYLWETAQLPMRKASWPVVNKKSIGTFAVPGVIRQFLRDNPL